MTLSDLLDGENHRDIHIAKDKIFAVYPLTLTGIAALFQSNEAEMTALLQGDQSIQKLVLSAPDFVAKIIAHAARQPTEAKAVLKMPVGVQVTALEAIWVLSMLDEDTLGKLISHLAGAVISAAQGLPNGLKALPK